MKYKNITIYNYSVREFLELLLLNIELSKCSIHLTFKYNVRLKKEQIQFYTLMIYLYEWSIPTGFEFNN